PAQGVPVREGQVVTARPWVPIIEKAGGPDAAMLHGLPLRARLSRVEDLEADVAAGQRTFLENSQRANAADERAARLVDTLEQERAALPASLAENEPPREDPPAA